MEESLTSADNLKSIRDARLEDLIVDNQVLLAQIELFEKKKGIVHEDDELTDEDLSDIDILQLAYSDEKPKKKKMQKKKLGAKPGAMKTSSVLRPKTAKSKTNKGRSKKPVDKKILKNNWNPQTSSAYGVKFGNNEKSSPEKQGQKKAPTGSSSEAMEKTKALREMSADKFSKLSSVEKDKIQKVDKQLNDEVSRAFNEMQKILSKY